MKLVKTTSHYWQASNTFNYAISQKLLNNKLLNEVSENEAFYSLMKNKEIIAYLYIYQNTQACTFLNFYPNDFDKNQASSMFLFIMEHLFNSINTNKICCDVIASNDEVLEFFMKHGFEIEGTFKDHIQSKSGFLDVTRLSCFKHNYSKYLKHYLTKLTQGKVYSINIGDEFSEEKVFNQDSIIQFAKLSGDDNPLHMDKDYAIKHGFQSNIVHGILAASIFSKILGTDFPGNGSIYISQDLKFLKPIYVGATIIVKLKILSIIGSKFVISTQIYSSGKVALQGRAQVIRN